MTFTSWHFGMFVAVVFGGYYLPALRTYQVQWLVIASLFFYGWGQPELLPLLALAVQAQVGVLPLRCQKLFLSVRDDAMAYARRYSLNTFSGLRDAGALPWR